MATTYTCYWSEMKCDGCGEQHKDCEKWDAICKQQEKDKIEHLEHLRKRLLSGKCDKCKVEGVKLTPIGGHIWELCDKCCKTYKRKN